MTLILALFACSTPAPEAPPEIALVVEEPEPEPVAPPVPAPTLRDGELDKDHIARVVGMHRVQVQRCYEKELMKDPALQGQVNLSFQVSKGAVGDVQVSKTTLNNPKAEQCLQDEVSGWRFAESLSTKVSYPFVFGSVLIEEEPEVE